MGATTDFGDCVAENGPEPDRRGPWAQFGEVDRRQGWKLHLSSVVHQAEALLDVVVPILVEADVSFKVARDGHVLASLNEGRRGATQIGKFLTVYPDSDEDSRRLAEVLVDATEGFVGPDVPSDAHLGGVVYTRYGGFDPLVCRNRLGLVETYIVDPDGELRPDEYDVPFEPSADVPNPFEDLLGGHASTRSAAVAAATGDGEAATEDGEAAGRHRDESVGDDGRLFGPGYRIVDVLKGDPTGSVFLALDLTARENVGYVAIKEGRRHTYADEYGRDMRTRLRRQDELHRELAPSVPIPTSRGYFEVDGDGYLALEYVEGKNLGSWTARPFGSRGKAERRTLLGQLLTTVEAVETLHEVGCVHRDLAPNNVRITEDGRAVLLDLELCHHVGGDEPPFSQGTPGYVSPQQLADEPPRFSDDVFSLGCLLVLLCSGLDPRLVVDPAIAPGVVDDAGAVVGDEAGLVGVRGVGAVGDDHSGRSEDVDASRITALTAAPTPLAATIARCLRAEASDRPTIDEVADALRGELRRDRTATGRWIERHGEAADGRSSIERPSAVEPTAGEPSAGEWR